MAWVGTEVVASVTPWRTQILNWMAEPTNLNAGNWVLYCPVARMEAFVVVCEVFSPSSFGSPALRTPLLSLQEVMRFTVVT